MVGQIDIHRARATDGGGNPHAHVLFSQRKVTPQGFGSKERSWEKLFRRDNSRWLRTLIASRLNRYCAAKAIDAAVDPRSNKARGTVSPEPRLPRRNWVEHRRGKTTEGLAKLKSLRVELRKARLEVNETENELQTLIDDAPVALIQQLRLRTIAPAYYLRKERGDLQREVAACLAVVEAQGWPLRSVRGGRCALEIDIGVARLRLVRGRIRLCGSLTVQGMEALAALIAALRWGHVNVIGDSSFRHAFELASLSHQAESILLPMQHGPARALLAEQDALEMRTIVAGIDLFGDVALSAAKPAPYRWVEAPRPHAGIRSRAETGTTQPDTPGSRDLRWPVTEV